MFIIIGAEPNKAYLLHLKNHNKYATVKNFANFSNCPICQIYQNGYIGNYPPPAAVPVPAPAPVKSAGIGTDHKLPNQVFQGVPIFVEKSPRISKKVYETNNKVMVTFLITISVCILYCMFMNFSMIM